MELATEETQKTINDKKIHYIYRYHEMTSCRGMKF